MIITGFSSAVQKSYWGVTRTILLKCCEHTVQTQVLPNSYLLYFPDYGFGSTLWGRRRYQEHYLTKPFKYSGMVPKTGRTIWEQ